MPIYEYEPCDRDCFICENRLQMMQGISEDALDLCPFCGMEIKKVVSRASFNLRKHHGAEDAGAKGFTTYKRSEKGVWEKVGGEGADYLVGSKEDMAAIEAEKQKPAKKLDLDKTE
ncbi:MAG: zinc ribbon domain-containing protein [Armatimonadetes bacterium]|nr:zinc ribbon domain-containing protein [Armatimonadota bacterium]